MIKIIINGCNGRMGQTVAAVAEKQEGVTVVAGIDPSDVAVKNRFPVFPSLKECNIKGDVIIDFSTPESLAQLLEGALSQNTPLVIATTGFTEEGLEEIKRHSESIPIFLSANMSLGVNLLAELGQKAAALLRDSFDIEIIEKHHNQKKDAPSGTAYFLANTINEVFPNRKEFVFGRKTRSGKRTPDEIGIHAIRAGTIVGEHNVIFAGKDEIVELNHISNSRQVFAEGALKAARYILRKTPGLYTMKHMIGEESTITNLYTSDEEALVTINHIPSKPQLITEIFEKLGRENIIIDMISQTAPVENTVNISFTLGIKDLKNTQMLLNDFLSEHKDIKIDILDDITKLTVEGIGMETQSGVAARVFASMAKENIEIKTITTSETKISYIIDRRHRDKAVTAVKTSFGL